MGTNANKKLVEEFFQLFSDAKVEQAFTMVSDDVSWWVPGTLPFSGTKTKAQYLRVVALIQSGFPGGLRLTLKGMIADGDKVAAEVESLGVHVNGKTYQNKYHFIFVVKDGKFSEVKEYMDTLHLKDLIS